MIQIVKTNEWSAMGGIGDPYILKPVGQIKLRVDFRKESNEYHLKHPIIIPTGSPLRFTIQLLSPRETMEGSGVEFKFRFHFNDNEFFIETGEYSISK